MSNINARYPGLMDDLSAVLGKYGAGEWLIAVNTHAADKHPIQPLRTDSERPPEQPGTPVEQAEQVTPPVAAHPPGKRVMSDVRMSLLRRAAGNNS